MTFVTPFKDVARLAMALVTAGLLIFSVAFYGHYRYVRLKLINSVKDTTQQKVATAATELDAFIGRLIPVAQTVAHIIGSRSLSKEQIETLLRRAKPIDFFGLGVAFAPYAFNTHNKLYGPYYFEKKGINELIDLGTLYDYTAPSIQWYNNPITNGANFSTPYMGITSGTILAEYATPFYAFDDKEQKHASGIVFANQSIDHLNHIIASQYQDQTGYWFIVSKEGIVLAHPEKKFTTTLTSFTDITQNNNNTVLQETILQAVKGKPTFALYNNEINGAQSWLICEPLTTTQWVLCHVFDISELEIGQQINGQQLPNFDRQSLMITIICALLAFILGITLCFSLGTPYPPTLWYCSASISVALICALAALWYVAHCHPDYGSSLQFIKSKRDLLTLFGAKNETQPISDSSHKDGPTDFDQALEVLNKTQPYQTLNLASETFLLIPTGLFINHIQLTADNKVELSCYLWQHYVNVDESIQRGFILPQASNVSILQIGHQKEGPVEKFVWLVEATLNQELVFQRYPFDVKNLEITIWPQNLEKQIILIPDFDSYELIHPRSLPGINPSAHITGWQFEGSYFGYNKIHYGTFFGMYSYGTFGTYTTSQTSREHELCFNVMIKRNLIDTIIADLIPLGVIALLLFVILVTATQQSYGVLGSCAAVFFGTIIEHERFRTKTGNTGLCFFENFYLIMYCAILAIVTVSLLYLLHFMIRFIQYRTNLISQLLFWPLMLFSMVFLTLVYLY